jgi:molecular chaperone DnaJ
MADKRDYYEVLGVNKNATDDEIKRAYRKKAKECHPDLHPDDKGAVERFKELNEANEVLSDPDKRARYDRYGFEDPMAGMGGENPFSGGFGFGMGDIFDQLFNGGMGSRTTRNQGPVQGNDLRYELRITFEEAAKGCEKSFEIFRNELCDTCRGTGAKPGTKPTTCAACQGTGQIRSSAGWMTTVRTCPTCRGAGKVITDKCPGCGGTGRNRKKRTVTVKDGTPIPFAALAVGEDLFLPYLNTENAPEKIAENTEGGMIYSVPFRRVFEDGIRHYLIEFHRLDLPEGKTGIVGGFKNVDEEERRKRH